MTMKVILAGAALWVIVAAVFRVADRRGSARPFDDSDESMSLGSSGR